MEEFGINENEAIAFILKRLPKELKETVKAEDVDFLLDLIYDYYDSLGLFSDEDANAEVEINEQEMVNYVSDRMAEAGRGEEISLEVIEAVLDGEYEYGKSQGVY